jgi:fatty acid-binding protein DegV
VNPIRIVTDNACDLPDALLAEHVITVVPLDVRLDDLPAEQLRGISAKEF